jgi:hypothetical protein
MTAKKQSPAKRGRKPLPPGEKPEQLTVRLTPKLKLGLELLLRAQRGRSLSQVVEWALQRGLNAIPASSHVSLGDLLDEIWPLRTEWGRLQRIYELSPALLDFVERSTYETIVGSKEYTLLTDAIAAKSRKQKLDPLDADAYLASPAHALTVRTFAALDFLVETNWEKIKAVVADRDLNGKPASGVYLLELLEIHGLIGRISDLEAILTHKYGWRPASAGVIN